VQDCVRDYPELEHALEPLLVLAQQLNETLAPAAPDASFVHNAKLRILNRVKSSMAITSSSKPRRRLRIDFRQRRWSTVVAGLLIAVMLFASTLGVNQASASALPGDSWYPIKRAGEEIQLALSFSAGGDMELLYSFAESRIEEAQALSAEGRFGDLTVALDGFEAVMIKLEKVAQNSEISEIDLDLPRIQEKHGRHIQVLEKLREQVPAHALAGIDRAIESSGHSQEVLRAIREGGSPSDFAPGQNREKPERKLRNGKPEKTEKPEK
jgi:hypothetical protein